MRWRTIEIDVGTLEKLRDVMLKSAPICDDPNTHGRLRMWAQVLTALIAQAIPKRCPAVAGPVITGPAHGKGKGRANPQHPLG